jgi:nucleoid-associated protein YgaU
MKLTPWLVLLSLSLVSCSGSKSAQKVNEETPQIELSDADEFIENPTVDEQPLAATETTEAPLETVAEDTPVETNEVSEVIEEPTQLADNNTDPTASEPQFEPTVSDTSVAATAPEISTEAGSTKQYTVKNNETLMIIAFKIYGDYERWKDIANQNREALRGSTSVKAGMVLNYMAPAEEFIWNPEGNPYLIRTGDTLAGISKEVYATERKWKLIWDNNRPLIKNPNRIFAGFTIYYLENGRDVASGI